MGVDFLDVAYELERRFAIEISDDEYDHMGETAGQLLNFVMAKTAGNELPRRTNAHPQPPNSKLGRFEQELDRLFLQRAKCSWRVGRWVHRTDDADLSTRNSEWTESDAWREVVVILVHVLQVNPQDITRESRLVEDLGMG